MYKSYRVISNVTMNGNGFARLVLNAADIALMALPGQFVMLKCWEGIVPFLMRPFSINSVRVSDGEIEFLYKITGEGTSLMQKLTGGDYVQVLGPLGSFFPIPSSAKRIAVIGRGVGAAPMRFLAEYARSKGIEVDAFFSASREEYLFERENCESSGAQVCCTIEETNLVTIFFEQKLEELHFDAAYVCGSKRLMHEVKRLSDIYGFAAYASLEEHMACGTGACKGCVCKVHNLDGSEHWARVCKEGPVFPLERLV